MAINGQALHDSKQAQFNAQGSVTRFDNDYVRAVNMAVDEYCILLEATPLTHITAVSQNIALDAAVEWIISAGIDKWILEFGNFKMADKTPSEARDDWHNALGAALHYRDTLAAAAAVKTTDNVMSGEVIG